MLAAIHNDTMRYYIALLTLLLFGCGNTETKKVIEKFDNGKDAIVYFYKDDDDTLTYRKDVFYESGKQKYFGYISKGTKDGVWTWWYENGNKKDQCKYANGFYVDTIYHWNENGRIKEIEIVKANTVRDDEPFNCNGTFIYYYENGNPKETFTWIDNIQQDTAKGWYENGQLKVISVWRDSVQNGLCREYYSNGQIKSEANFIDGWEDGKVTFWDSLGNVMLTENWKDKKLLKQN